MTKDITPSLRKSEVKLEAMSSNMKSGWFEMVEYSSTWYKNCKHPQYKDNVLLNQCGYYAPMNMYLMLNIVAHPNYNYYTFYYSFYSDSACSNLFYSGSENLPILICSDDYYYHVIPQPLNPLTDNLNGFAFGVYDTASNCQAGEKTGLLDATYMKLNFCYQDDSGDYMYSNCSNTDGTLTQTTYVSTDGSCNQGVQSTVTWTSADTCSNTQNGMGTVGFYSGPTTFICEN
jgi:hypothetical protein